MVKYSILFVVFPIIIFAQFDDIQFEYLSVDDGLSSSYAICITQDNSGFLWIGTANGLNKYDGYKFTTFKHNPFDTTGLSDNIIYALCLDQSGYLWIGTGTGGLNRYNPRTESFICFKHDPDNPQSLSSNNILAICQDKSGNLWIGTERGGLNQLIYQSDTLNTGKFLFKRFYHEPGNQKSLSGNTINTIFEDSQRKIWIGTTNGLSKLSIINNEQVRIKNYHHDTFDPYSLSHNNVSTVCEDLKGNVWIGTKGGGVNRFNSSNEKFYHYINEPGNDSSLSHNRVSTIQTDRNNDNILWVGTFNGGINRLDIKSGKIKRFEAVHEFYLHLKNYVFDLYQDASGLIWVAGWAGGICKFNPKRNKFIKYQPGLGKGQEDVIWSIYENPNSKEKIIWLISAGGGVLKFNRTKNKFKRYLSNLNHSDYKARNLLINLYGEPKRNNPSQSILWMGSIAKGIIRFDCEEEKFKYYADDPAHILSRIHYQVRSIYPDPRQENIVWIGTNAGGLFKYDRERSILKQYNHQANDPHSLSHPFVHHVLRDRTGHLWISTFGGGLNRMVETDETFVHYRHNPTDTSSISHNWVNITFESSSGQLWVGTRGGLNKFDRKNNSFSHYSEKEGLSNNIVFGILEDGQNYLWLSTTNGLSRFNPKGKGKKAFRNYDVGDGLHGNEFENKAYFQSKSGEIYTGGIRGFTIFHPDHIKDNPYIPDIVITDLKIYDESLKLGNNSPLKQTISQTHQIKLEYNQNSLTFEFSALDYLNPLKNKYAYKMEGVDLDWINTDASRRFATYTQLDLGDYIFRVKGSNNDGLWNEDGTSIRIFITPPWWRTIWAYSVYAILFFFTLYAIRTYDQKRQRLKQELEMEHLHSERLEEIDGIKSRFFANISHEFRTPLTLILGPLQSVFNKISDTGLKNDLNIIRRNANRLKILVNQLLDLSRLEAGKMTLQVQKLDIIPLLRELVLTFTSFAERKKISLLYRNMNKSLFTYIDKDKIDKILNNLLSNAFKFTQEGGKIVVTVRTKQPPFSSLSRGDTGRDNKTNSKFRIPNSDFIEISVTNTGSAIPPDKIKRIFDRFYQVDDSYTRDHEGSGIGLSLVKEMVELHHGKVDVHCHGTGLRSRTTFIILLPFGREPFSHDEIIEQSLDKNADLSKTISEKSPLSEELYDETEIEQVSLSKQEMPLIILIEDNTDMRTYIRNNLRNSYHIIEAVNGRQGLDLAIQKHPDLVISDIMMPIMDGFQVCEEIKSDIRTSHIPLILLTARAEKRDKLKGLEFGADDYISKPFVIEELQVRVKNLIKQRQKLRERFSREALFGVKDISLNRTDEKFLQHTVDIIQQHIDDPQFTLQKLGDSIGMSRMTLHLKLKALTHQSPHNFIRLLRLKRAAFLLQQKNASVTEVAYEVGFKNLSHFAKVFNRQFGETPSHFSARY